MGKFKELDIELKEASELLRAYSDPEECNCDQALKLKTDLQIAINFGVSAEEEIDKLQTAVSIILTELIDKKLYTVKEIQAAFAIKMQSIHHDTNNNIH